MVTYDLNNLIGSGDALIIIPPFAGINRPSLGAHLIQATSQLAGFNVRVFYANLALAQVIGDRYYEAVSNFATGVLLGERLFCLAAYGLPPLGYDTALLYETLSNCDISDKIDLSPEVINSLEIKVREWVAATAEAIAKCNFSIVGCSTTFEQTAASIAILNRIKCASPHIITVLGGANCEGEMAEGLLSLKAKIDYIFSGTSEISFPEFVSKIHSGRYPSEQIIRGEAYTDLDLLPTPNYRQYFEQRDYFLPESEFASNDNVWIPYESSRGCWWGEKHQCSFCGINGLGIKYREKSADRVISELRDITEKHGLKRICMVDNIMPHHFFDTLIPRLGNEISSLYIFYEQKANLSLDQIYALKKAGVEIVQPGIEALSTNLLRLMNKGVTAPQNIASLRFARSVNIVMNWNLLCGFPNDKSEDYKCTLALLPSVRHLQPPADLCRLSIDRFSPYFNNPAKYGIHNLRAMDSYYSVLPDNADIYRIAYHFIGDYDCGAFSNLDLLKILQDEVLTWHKIWDPERDFPPTLAVVALSSEDYILIDTRGLTGELPVHFVNREHAMATLVANLPGDCSEAIAWALEHKYAVELDGRYVPLATAAPELIYEFMDRTIPHS